MKILSLAPLLILLMTTTAGWAETLETCRENKNVCDCADGPSSGSCTPRGQTQPCTCINYCSHHCPI